MTAQTETGRTIMIAEIRDRYEVSEGGGVYRRVLLSSDDAVESLRQMCESRGLRLETWAADDLEAALRWVAAQPVVKP